jgi:N-acetylglucosamine kinase-like BadF-type ATPase
VSTEVRYYIGIEGFNMRHSTGVLATPDGKIRSATRKPLNMSLHATDRDLLTARLNKMLQDLLRKAQLKEADLKHSAVCLSLTGVTFSYDRLVVLPRLVTDAQLEFGRLTCTGDAEVTFASHAQCAQGSLVVSHSGSTAYAVGMRDDVLRHYRFGGWGPAIGDEGSGFWIGREALRAIGLEHDAHREESLLWTRVRTWLEKPTPGSVWDDASQHWNILLRDYRDSSHKISDPRTLLFSFAHRVAMQPPDDDTWRKTVCGIAIPVMQAYVDGDAAATRIVHEAVEHLAAQHRGVCDIARQRGGIQVFQPLVLYGGVLNHNPFIRDLLCRKLEEHLHAPVEPITSETADTMRPVMGALMFALGQSVTHQLRLPPMSVIDLLKDECRQPKVRDDLLND